MWKQTWYTKIIIILICTFVSCTSKNKSNTNSAYKNRQDWRIKTSDGASLYITEFGKGDTVLVVHGGFGAEHSYLLPAFMSLANDYHFVFYDQRGSLRSPCPDSTITIKQHIDDIEIIREELGLNEIEIVAHSMGGYLAMSYAAEYTDKVKNLILVSSPPAKCNIDSLIESIEIQTLERKERADVIEELDKYSLNQSELTDRQSYIKKCIHFGAINLHNVKKWKAVRQGVLYYSPVAADLSSKSMSSPSWNFINTLKEQEIPISILHGDDDYLPYTFHNSWKDSLRNVESYIIENAGHCLWVDNYISFEKAIFQALQK